MLIWHLFYKAQTLAPPYDEMEILRLAFLLKFWAGLLPPSSAPYIRYLGESFSPLCKSSSPPDFQTFKLSRLSKLPSLLDPKKKFPTPLRSSGSHLRAYSHKFFIFRFFSPRPVSLAFCSLFPFLENFFHCTLAA